MHMTMGADELCLAQEERELPTTLAAGNAPRESGVHVLYVRFQGGVHITGTMRRHLICFQLAHARFDCRIGGRGLRHEPPVGSLAIRDGVELAAPRDLARSTGERAGNLRF